CARDSNYDYW
nr:immunoglobulin heavy chain junction region [Mus musculus]